MPSPKKRYRYTFIYTDQTYITYDLTKDDLEAIEDQLFEGRPFASITIGIVGLKDIRSIIEQKEPEIELDESGEPTMNTVPVLDQESYEWIKQYMGGE